MNKTTIIVVILALLAFGGVYVFSKSSTTNQVPVSNNLATPTSQVATSPTSTQVKEVSVEAGSFYFKPSEITVNKGDRVKITMKSVSLMHDFTLDEFNVKMPVVKDGETGSVEFTADKSGTFEYYCSVGQHRENGQVGKLIVKE